MVFVLAVLIAVGMYYYFYRKTKDSMNPFGVSILIYFVMYGLSTLNLSIYQTPMLFYTHVMCWIPVAIISVIGAYYCNNYRHVFLDEQLPIVTPNYRRIMWILCGLCLISALYLIMTRGVTLSLDFSQSQALNTRKAEITEQVYEGSGILGKLTQLFPYAMVFVVYDLFFSDEKTFTGKILEIGYCVLCTLYALFVLASRGTLLLSVLAILYLFNKKHPLRPKSLAILLFGIMLAFTAYMSIRVIAESAVFSGTAVANRTFNSIYNYFALSFNNFDKLVQHGSPFTIIEHSLISLSRILGVYNEADLIRNQTLIFNSAIFLYGFYHDLGIIGVIIWPTIIFLVIGKIYVLSKEKKPEMVLLLGMFGKAIFVLSFGNYFFGSISQELPYYACLLLLIYGYKFKQVSFFKIRHIRLKLRSRTYTK